MRWQQALTVPLLRVAAPWRWLPLLLVGLLATGLPATTQAATLTVCPSGCPYSTIAAAIAAASPGDTIRVGAGTYPEHLLLSKALTIRGAGEQQTIVDGSHAGQVVTIAAGVASSTKAAR